MRIENVARQWALVQPSAAMLIASMVPNIHDSQDILQDVAEAVFSHDFDKSSPQSFRAWVMGIARHKALDFYRSKSRKPLPLLLDSAVLDQLVRASNLIVADLDREREALEHCLQALPEKSRKLLTLRYQQNHSCEEIAAENKVGLSAIKMALHRLRIALRDCLDRQLSNEQSLEGT